MWSFAASGRAGSACAWANKCVRVEPARKVLAVAAVPALRKFLRLSPLFIPRHPREDSFANSVYRIEPRKGRENLAHAARQCEKNAAPRQDGTSRTRPS